ncbi:hypothetical protein B0I33_107300 [Prauserella shujinwangii]|uniref:Integral membrane protein n=1 Tax=Prauserella shujinwangii TaxID=1453103 RepID=A0A2T0LSX1_9PSEU|nr:hypothetical protein [Prauserella shujinwangii]PRX46722.1 hypothetical protein B0I33_107300 [Prauserella shujinwangii]
MSATIRTSTLAPLRLALRLDGVATTLTGAALLPLAGVLDTPLGLPASLLLGTGAFFVVFGVAVLALATRRHPPRAAVRAVIAVNVLWVLDSAVTVAAGWFAPTALGTAVIVTLAVVVAAGAALQALASRRA